MDSYIGFGLQCIHRTAMQWKIQHISDKNMSIECPTQLYGTLSDFQCLSLGSVSSVYYWPIAPEKKGDYSVVNEDTQRADHMFLRSHISSSVLLPMTRFETVKMIAKKIRCKGQLTRNFKLPDCQTQDFEKYCSLHNIHSCKDTCLRRMENAFHCYDFLLECSQLEKKELKENVHRHALQLCYFLAARSGKLW